MGLLILLVLTLPVLSRGLPFTFEENNSNNTAADVLAPKKSVQLFRDQESILDEKANEIFRGNPFIGSESFIPALERRGMYCRHKAKCEQLSNNTCLGVRLPYLSSTTDLVALSREEATEKLNFWETTLSHVPKCWAVIQPFLCALYMPKCEEGIVDLPSQEMCKMAASSCRILAEERHWISPLQCDDINRFPPMCKNDVRELRFNTSTQCMSPLVATDNPSAYFEGVEGCGLPCANPLYTPEEHLSIQTTMAWLVGVLILMSTITVLSFVINWRYAKKFPSVAVFYMTICSLATTIGFLVQFFPGARESILCRRDGTSRKAEPTSGENYYCIIAFILIYYPLIAKFMWFAVYFYAWNLQVQGQVAGKIKDVDKYRAYFHLGAWCLPVLPTIATLAMSSIDGNSELGICFVSMEQYNRYLLLFAPMILCFSIGACYSLRVRVCLEKLIKGCEEVISEGSSAKIRRLLRYVVISTIGGFVLVILGSGVHLYEFQYRDSWQNSFRSFVTCKIMRGAMIDKTKSPCRMTSKPNVILIYVQLLLIFGAGCITNFWVWTPSNFHTWARFICGLLSKEEDEPPKLKKHHVIARTFAKRQALNRLGRISISIHSNRDDPVGLDFELNSVASRGMSSTWVAALPKLVTRRGALRLAGSTSSQQRNSYDSDMSYGGRVSLESRRQSLDSQLSVAMGDIGGRKSVTPIGGVSGGRVKSRRRQRRRNGLFGRTLSARRSSSTSQDSQLSAQLLSTLAMAMPSIQTCVPNLKRRTGNAGLDGDLPLNIKNPTLGPGLGAPLFPLFHRNISGSEDENAKGRESKKELPEKELSQKDTSSPNNKEDNESTPNEGLSSKERRCNRISAALSTSSDEDGKLKPDQNGVDKRNSGVSRRPQNKRYSKHDMSKKSGEEDIPMLEKTSGKAVDDDDDDLDSSKETPPSTSRLKHAREIGTQTSMLSVNEIDACVLTR